MHVLTLYLHFSKLTFAATFVNVLMGKTAHTGGVTKINGVAGSVKKYIRL